MSSDFAAMSLHPRDQLPQVRQLIGWEDAMIQLTASKVNLLHQIQALQSLLGAMDDDEIQMSIVRCYQQMGEMEREIAENAQACERLVRQLGPDFKDALQDIKAKDRLEALHILEKRFAKYEENYSQVQRDIWRTTMFVIKKNEQPVLVSQSDAGVQGWAEIMQKPIDSHQISYGADAAAHEQGIVVQEDVEEAMAPRQMERIDHFLDRQGLSWREKEQIYREFHQGILGFVTPERMQQADMAVASNRQKDLRERCEHYQLAAWRTGRVSADPIEPGSELDTNGFAAFYDAEGEPVAIQKSVALCVDIQKKQVIGYYLVMFESNQSRGYGKGGLYNLRTFLS